MARGSRSCEESRIGGTCVLRGCVPKKLLVYGAQFADAFADAAGFGWSVAPPKFDWPSLIAAKNKELDRLEQIYVNMLQQQQRRDHRGARRAGRPAHGRGRRPALYRREHPDRDRRHPTVPDIPGIEHVISSNEALDLPRTAAPDRDRRRRLYRGRVRRHLPRLRVARSSRSSGARNCCTALTTISASRWRRRCATAASRSTPARRSRASRRTRARATACSPTIGQEISADLVMYATGRGPNTKGLGLAEIGIETKRNGAVIVDEWQRTQRAEHLRGRRRDRPAQPDAGGDRRGPRHRRDAVQQQPDQDGPRRRADRGVQQPADRHGRADRGTGARAIRRRCRRL